MSQNLASNIQIFASALIDRQVASVVENNVSSGRSNRCWA